MIVCSGVHSFQLEKKNNFVCNFRIVFFLVLSFYSTSYDFLVFVCLRLCPRHPQAMPSTVDEYRAYVAEQARLELEAEQAREAEEGELMASEDVPIPMMVRLGASFCL